jgi:hypothetical protein
VARHEQQQMMNRSSYPTVDCVAGTCTGVEGVRLERCFSFDFYRLNNAGGLYSTAPLAELSQLFLQ